MRLTGPVRGRSGVCRDLDTDLARIKSAGVDLIVNCLDDEELEFLGAPWPQYHKAARRLSLDVLRLPTPEGLAPALHPATLDALVARYTMQGRSILVHCRGGVGRASVVGICWLIRVGLLGSLLRPAHEIVSSAINFVRAHRSPKAIETYEQVKFLVEYVEHLQSQ